MGTWGDKKEGWRGQLLKGGIRSLGASAWVLAADISRLKDARGEQ